MTTSIIITATLNHIRFRNDTGFVIGMASGGDTKGEFGILGNMSNPVEGMQYKLSGKWSNHSEYGKQFNFNSYSTIKPADSNGIFKYLVRTAKWVGPTIASRMIDLYGEKTLEVLRSDPELIAAEIQGITETKALGIQETLLEHEQEESILVDLMKILNIPGLRKSLPHELIQKFGLNAADILRRNPYVITQFHGSGFLIADRLAMHSLNIPNDSMFRIKAAIQYAMRQDLHNGSTWITRKRLTQDVKDLIGDVDGIIDGIAELLAVEAIVDASGGEWLALWEVDRDETYVANKIKEMANHGNG